MARVLAYTSPSRGDLFPIVPVLAELRARGHEVRVRTLDAVVETLRRQGFEAEPIAPEIEAITHDDHRARSSTAAIKRSLAVFARRAALERDDLRTAIATHAPDAVLMDFNCWGAAAVAERAGLPWARWCSYPLPLPSAGAPPFGPGFAPARGMAGRARDRVLGPVITGVFERAILPAVNAVRAAEQLPELSGVRDLVAAAPVTLAMTAEPFEYAHADWPSSVKLIGPCAWEPPSAAPAWLEEIELPVVLVTTSSEFQDDGRLVQVAIEALRDEPVHVVATMPAADPAQFNAHGNVHVVRFLPHSAVLARAVCAVTHAGMGATQKALAHGVPVVAVPFGRDQWEVARRVEVAGAGVRLPSRTALGRRGASALAEAVRAARELAPGARQVADAFRRAGNGAAGADAVDQLLGVAPA
ncbi:glycosyltransferase [uncultured Jatrophihabitans sp.]|uniref:glycosyltransferase n=1 Tax=uncultured Jatrophihabitans sp. TaxID=1610747 RepID=UPI0035C951C0